MERAKDLIADEQWARAIDELKAAAADPKETNKDEALFWLAHSQNQARDLAGAVETIQPARARVSGEPLGEAGAVAADRDRAAAAAQRCAVVDAVPPPLRPPAACAARGRRRRWRPPVPPRRRAGSACACDAARVQAAPACPCRRPRPRRRPQPPAPTTAPLPPTPPPAWVPEGYLPDTDLRIQALGSLMRTDAAKVIPMLREIALESGNTGEARRALFVLAQSGRPDARSTVIEVAKTGPEVGPARRRPRARAASAAPRSRTICCRCTRRPTSA